MRAIVEGIKIVPHPEEARAAAVSKDARRFSGTATPPQNIYL